MEINILVVDDIPAVRQYLRKLLSASPGLSIVAEVEDGATAIQKAETINPDIILMDINMPLVNGLEAARQILRLIPAAKIIFLTEHLSPEMLLEALHTGASGYLIKSDMAQELLPAIRSVHDGNTYISRYFHWEDNA